MELTGEPRRTAADWSGYLMAVYALLQFFMAPVFGNLSDRFGRRPMLLASLFAFGVDFLLTGLATSMTWLFIGRAFAGVFGASFSAAGAYIGDISNDSNRAKNFGFIGAAWGCGLHAGAGHRRIRGRAHRSARAVLRGGGAGARERGVRIVRAAGVAAARASGASSSGRAPIRSARSRACAHLPMVAGLLFAVFLYQIAHDSLPAVWMFYTQHKFGWGRRRWAGRSRSSAS